MTIDSKDSIVLLTNYHVVIDGIEDEKKYEYAKVTDINDDMKDKI